MDPPTLPQEWPNSWKTTGNSSVEHFPTQRDSALKNYLKITHGLKHNFIKQQLFHFPVWAAQSFCYKGGLLWFFFFMIYVAPSEASITSNSTPCFILLIYCQPFLF